MSGKMQGKDLFCGLERAIEGDDRVSRRRLLSRLVSFLSSTDNAAPAFISRGGVYLLLAAARDADEKVSIPALDTLLWLARAGYAHEILTAGGRDALPALLSHPFDQVRAKAEELRESLNRESGES